MRSTGIKVKEQIDTKILIKQEYNNYQMDLQFTLQQQSLQTLCFHWIVSQNKKSKTLITNSILMNLASNPNCTFYHLFDVCRRIVDDNKTGSGGGKGMVDKEYAKNMATLLREILGKYPKSLNKVTQQQLVDIIKYANHQVFCAISGNDYIALIALICSKTTQGKSAAKLSGLIQQILMNPKMHVGSYRQSTRLNLFSLLYKIVASKTQEQFTSQYISKIIRLVQDEKDPRNISRVFQIYSVILNGSSRENLQANKKKIFDSLQMYFPIDFQGDAQLHSIKLKDIASLLDQNITHPIFAEEIRALLMIKMGAAPIGKYISTFIQTRSHLVTESSIIFWTNLLQRTSEQQYIQQQYQQSAQYTLSDLIVQLISRLAPNPYVLNLPTYTALATWLKNLVTIKVLQSDQNSKYAPFIIQTLKKVMGKCKSNVAKNFIAGFVVHDFIQSWNLEGDIVYKLGILVPILEACTSIDVQKAGLLILTLSKVFHSPEPQPQPKLIVLKLYMILSKQPTFKKMITQTNIHISCLDKIGYANAHNNTSSNFHTKDNKEEKDVRVLKSYIDFLVDVYADYPQVVDNLKNYEKMDVRVYGLLCLASKIQGTYQYISNLISTNPHQILPFLMSNLPTKVQPLLQTVSNLAPSLSVLPVDPKTQQKYMNQITQSITEKCQQLMITEQDIMDFIDSYVENGGFMMLYFSRFVWRQFLIVEILRNKIRGKLYDWLEGGSHNHYFRSIVAFYNKSITTFQLGQAALVSNDQITQSQSYQQQLYRMLPVEKGHLYTIQQCLCWPTLTHYSWQTNPNGSHKLIPYLPPAIMTNQSQKILPIILPNSDICTLAKILQSIPQSTLIQQIIPYLVKYLQNISQQTQVEKIVALNKMFFDLETRSKEDSELRAVLVANKGRVLVGIEERVLQNRKRRARQSGRTVFSLYNTIK